MAEFDHGKGCVSRQRVAQKKNLRQALRADRVASGLHLDVSCTNHFTEHGNEGFAVLDAIGSPPITSAWWEEDQRGEQVRILVANVAVRARVNALP